MNKTSTHFLIIICALLSFSCSEHSKYHDIIHKEHESELKAKAIQFIAEQAYKHGEIRYSFEDNLSVYDSISYTDRVQKVNNNIFAQENSHHYILDTILSPQTIEIMVDDALKTLSYSWTKDINEKDFIEYVLPYRVKYEPIDLNQHKIIYATYQQYLDSGITSRDTLVQKISAHLGKWFIFNEDFVKVKQSPSISDLYEVKQGGCPSMTMLAIYTLRKFGVPVTRDHVPYWCGEPSFMSGHSWNVSLSDNGKWKPFSIDGYADLDRKSGKVFRETFVEHRPVDLLKYIDSHLSLPSHLRDFNRLDVTDEYFETSDINWIPERKNKDFYFLASYNKGQWKAITYGISKNGKVQFKKLAHNIFYLPISYNNRVIVEGNPFYLDSLGNKINLSGKAEYTSGQLQKFRHMPNLLAWMKGKVHGEWLEDQNSYTLLKWENKWKEIGKYTPYNSIVKLDSLQENTLYSWSIRTEKGEVRKGEQLFYIHNGKQVF